MQLTFVSPTRRSATLTLEMRTQAIFDIGTEHAAPVWTCKSTLGNTEEEKARGVQLAQDYPLAKVPKDVAQLRLKITDAIDRWSVNEEAAVPDTLLGRCGAIKVGSPEHPTSISDV